MVELTCLKPPEAAVLVTRIPLGLMLSGFTFRWGKRIAFIKVLKDSYGKNR